MKITTSGGIITVEKNDEKKYVKSENLDFKIDLKDKSIALFIEGTHHWTDMLSETTIDGVQLTTDNCDSLIMEIAKIGINTVGSGDIDLTDYATKVYVNELIEQSIEAENEKLKTEISEQLSNAISQDDLETIINQITTSLTNAGLSEDDKTFILNLVNSQISEVDNLTSDDVVSAIDTALSQLPEPLTSEQIKEIVNESMVGFDGYATEIFVNEKISNHANNDLVAWQYLFDKVSALEKKLLDTEATI